MREVFEFNDLFHTFDYPAGEPHVRMIDNSLLYLGTENYIIAEAYDWNDLMNIKIANSILLSNDLRAKFVIPYMPFGRHDRKNDNLEASPIVFALDLLATVDVITIDPHSDVSGIFPHFPQSAVVEAFSRKGLFDNGGSDVQPVVAIPDAGAAKKAYTWLNGRDVVQCLKTRDPKTGKLSGFQVIDPEGIVDGRDVVIVDDICDGGGTFIGLADELYTLGAAGMRLAVTHGLFTKGLDDLVSDFDRIYTLDVYKFAGSDPELTVVSTEDLIKEGTYF